MNVEFRVFNIYEARLDGEPNKMRVGLGSDFAFDRVVMIANRFRAEIEQLRNGLARQPSSQQPENFGFAWSELLGDAPRPFEPFGRDSP